MYNNINEKKIDTDFIHKGNKVLPNLKTAILAKLRGYKNGSYPGPLSETARELGYYPLSDATEEEKIKIAEIESKLRV